jgi:protein tyrosine/serine phosphatase
MKQLETLDRLRPLIASVPGIRGALLIGSFARGNPKWNSDLDLSFWVDEWFDPQEFIARARDAFGGVFQYGLHSSRRGHLALYFTDRPKADIGLYGTLSGLDRNVLGSEIQDIGAAILWDPAQLLKAHLARITQGQVPGGIDGYAAEVGRLADKFLYEFEQCSEAHRRSDSYKSYFFYNIALHAAIQIRYLARGGRSFHFLPKNFAACMLTREEDHAFRALRGSLYLPEIHEAKRRLIDFFLEGLRESQAVDAARIAEMEHFCAFVCQRDRLWNFRDLADINPRLKRGRIFRASSLTRYQHEPFFPGFLAGRRIGKVLDLRDDDELARNPYAPGSLGAVRHIRLPIDPRKQSEHFQAHYHQGTHKEIAYRYFAVECKPQIRQLFEILAEPDDTAAVIHCHAGKDRTGVLATLIHLLSGADEETVLMEYLASEMDSDPALLQAFREVVDQSGSIRDYLLSCGIAPATLDAFLAQYRNHPPA